VKQGTLYIFKISISWKLNGWGMWLRWRRQKMHAEFWKISILKIEKKRGEH
jgi:hypothetical protein